MKTNEDKFNQIEALKSRLNDLDVVINQQLMANDGDLIQLNDQVDNLNKNYIEIKKDLLKSKNQMLVLLYEIKSVLS